MFSCFLMSWPHWPAIQKRGSLQDLHEKYSDRMLENALQDMFRGYVSYSCCVACLNSLETSSKTDTYLYLTFHLTALLYLNTLIIIAGDFICIDWQGTVKLAINIYLPLCCMKTMLFLSDLSFLRSGMDFDSLGASVWKAGELVGVNVISEVSGLERCELHSHQCSVVIFKTSVNQ